MYLGAQLQFWVHLGAHAPSISSPGLSQNSCITGQEKLTGKRSVIRLILSFKFKGDSLLSSLILNSHPAMPKEKKGSMMKQN